MAVEIVKGKDAERIKTENALRQEAIVTLKKIVVAHDDLHATRKVRRAKAARKIPLIMKRARRIVGVLGNQQAA